METLRAFIAVNLGEEVRDALDQLQRRLKKVHANVRWVNPRSMHLTLAFLGDIASRQVPDVQSAMDFACSSSSPFRLEVRGTGTFGRPRYPRVIWAGIAENRSLTDLQRDIATCLKAEQIEYDDKPFAPHLTLGRVKGIDRHTEALLRKLEEKQAIQLGQIEVDAIELIQSKLTPSGAIHTILYRAPISADQPKMDPFQPQ